jgi:hypothetical protein
MGISSYILSLDFIGLEPKFRFQGGGRYKTYMGGVLSITLYMLFIAGMIYFGKDLYVKETPTLMSSNSLNPHAAPLELLPENFPFFFALEDAANNLNYFKDETIYKMQALLRTQKRVKGDNGIVKLETQMIPIKMVDCDLDYHFPDLRSQFNTTTYQLAYCIAPGQNVTIQGDFPDDVFNFLQINFFQCANTTTDSSCKPQSVIDKSIRNTYISINYGFYLMRPNNYESPMNHIKQDYFTTVSNLGFKQINIYLKRVFVTTDSGIIFEDRNLDTYNQIDHIQELATNVVPGPGERLFNIGIRMSYSEDNVYRHYLKLQEVAANVGGLFKFFSLSFELLILALTKQIYYLELFNNHFRINDEKAFIDDITIRLKKERERDINLSGGAVVNNFIESNAKIIQATSGLVKNVAGEKNEKNRDNFLNQKVKTLKQGSKLKFGYCDLIKSFYCRSKEPKAIRNRQIYNKGVKVIKQCIDINEVIAKLLEFERLKRIVLENDQLILFNSSPLPNMEGGMESGAIKNTEYCFQELKESFYRVNEDVSPINQRLIDLYDETRLDFLRGVR